MGYNELYIYIVGILKSYVGGHLQSEVFITLHYQLCLTCYT